MNESNIHILLVAAFPPPPGGDSTWAANFLSNSEKYKIKVDSVNTAVIGKRAANVNDSFVLVDEAKRSFNIWKGIHRSIRRRKPSLVHMNTNCSPVGLVRDYISSCVVKFNKTPLIVHCHTNVGFKINNSRLGNFFLKLLANNAESVIVLNKKSKEYISAISNTKTVIIPNFIEEEYIRKTKRQISEVIKNIVFIGHVRKEKGIDELLEAANQFKDIKFYVVGPITDHYQGYIPESNVDFVGSVSPDEVREYLEKCDVFLFPTYSEGFSVALIEAMACGIPVIATNVGANNDMLENKGGLIIEPMDVDAIIKAIKEIKKPEIRKSMSYWNINKVNEAYKFDIVIEQLKKLYLETIERKKKV